MTRYGKRSLQTIGIRLSIWSIRHQSWLAGNIRIYTFTGTALIAFLALAGVISIQTAILASFSSGLIAAGLIWTLIQLRKSILLNIREPEVRNQAHKAMLAYLREIDPDILEEMGVRRMPLNRGNECPECRLH